ncbi:hypothetical protein [Streptomyces hiroshimensis]
MSTNRAPTPYASATRAIVIGGGGGVDLSGTLTAAEATATAGLGASSDSTGNGAQDAIGRRPQPPVKERVAKSGTEH